MEFLSFNEYVLNESLGNPIKTKDVVQKYLESIGETVVDSGTRLDIELPNQIKALPSKYNKIIQKVIKMSNGNMSAVQTAVGYYMGNSISFIFPIYEAKLRKAYHVASAQNVDSILQSGLEPRFAQEHSNEFGSSLGDRNMEQTYKAAFVVGSKPGVKIVTDMFNIPNPVILEIDTKGLEFWKDPLMPEDAKSALTFDKIPADRIKKA